MDPAVEGEYTAHKNQWIYIQGEYEIKKKKKEAFDFLLSNKNRTSEKQTTSQRKKYILV